MSPPPARFATGCAHCHETEGRGQPGGHRDPPVRPLPSLWAWHSRHQQKSHP
ncbi:c-type cytochrome [Aeromonas hydrophila]|uniref:c-type cytochrome n=1 Tax=Aeromonas hydrophila TaxID=644 RepID=UPI0039C8696C